MYFCNSEINEYLENRSEDIAAFLTSGWGKVRINDLLILFDVPAAFFRNIMIHLAGLYHFMQEDDYVYIHIGDEKSNIYLKDSKEAVKTINLFDEIIINPNNIKEGDILY